MLGFGLLVGQNSLSEYLHLSFEEIGGVYFQFFQHFMNQIGSSLSGENVKQIDLKEKKTKKKKQPSQQEKMLAVKVSANH